MLPKPEFFEHIHSGRLGAERAEITAYTEDGVTLSNGAQVNCDLVILATGWRTDYGFLAEDIRRRIGFEEDGYYLYRQIVHPDVPNLAFIGSNAATYINILTHNLQARWLTELLRGTHQLPDRNVLFAEIEAMKEWKRRIVPQSTARAATLHLHMQHYHDDLLRDMGLSPRRKRGALKWVKELLSPYQPSDYADVTSGEAFGTRPQRRDKSWLWPLAAERPFAQNGRVPTSSRRATGRRGLGQAPLSTARMSLGKTVAAPSGRSPSDSIARSTVSS
jgi:hypothetical protein